MSLFSRTRFGCASQKPYPSKTAVFGRKTGVQNRWSSADPLLYDDVNETSDPTLGWIYNKDTGDIIANTDDTDDNTVNYYDY